MNLRKLYQWVKKGSRRWTGLTRFERQNIIDFSRGVVRSQSSQLRTIARSVGNDSQRRRLQRFVGGELDMKAWGQAWSAWVVQEFRVRAVTLAVDETKINARIGVMVVGMVYEGRCIPLVWRHDYPPAKGSARWIGWQPAGAGLSRPRYRHLAAADAWYKRLRLDVFIPSDQAK